MKEYRLDYLLENLKVAQKVMPLGGQMEIVKAVLTVHKTAIMSVAETETLKVVKKETLLAS